jgi:hypothetical protein
MAVKTRVCLPGTIASAGAVPSAIVGTTNVIIQVIYGTNSKGTTAH